MKRWLFALPLVALIGFAGLGLVQLFDGRTPEFQREIRDAPTRAFAPLGAGPDIAFTDLALEAPIVVNLWASWCTPCLAEHPLLMDLSAAYPGRVHGLVFDDTRENAAAFLAQHGNPFTHVLMDENGQGALDFGHTGVPETFVVSPDGQVVYHRRGQLLPEDIADVRAALAASALSN